MECNKGFTDVSVARLVSEKIRTFTECDDINELTILKSELYRENKVIALKDYSSGIPIQISVYADKIIFWNKGTLPKIGR